MADDRSAKVAVLKTRCPICRKPAVLEFRPFCSKHCADLDLGKWLGGAYRVKTDETPGTPEDEKP
jgi:endogenous inhibitor of DNA gyrase (YacG/DUF329 family)